MAGEFVRQDISTLEQQQPWHPVTMAYALAVREMRRVGRRLQLTQRRVQLIESGGGHDLAYPRGREPGRGGEGCR
jgi:hypothetical protein